MSGANDGQPPTPPSPASPETVPCRARVEVALLEDGNIALQAEGQSVEIAYLLLVGQHLWLNQHMAKKGKEQRAKSGIVVPSPIGFKPA